MLKSFSCGNVQLVQSATLIAGLFLSLINFEAAKRTQISGTELLKFSCKRHGIPATNKDRKIILLEMVK